ncbi:MAG TPA: chemotaxis response regulator protein-glutamate methylesterase [Alphaproteobacteria bacterium]|nr:chemotaxis response regulator protein-glutamate methylesterase [Alphaproteobacteria bacterium]
MSQPRTTAGSNPPTATSGDPYRVVVVDDSAIIRGLLARTLEADPEIKVVETVSNGQLAIGAVKRSAPDVVVLDIEMPVMDGLTALPELIKGDPTVKVIMASTLTLRNADISMRALALGAADYIPKPTSSGDISQGYDFKRELVAKVKALGAARRASGTPRPVPVRHAEAGAKPAPGHAPSVYRDVEVRLREAPTVVPAVVGIGTSTGGPQALFQLLPLIAKNLRQPILITQHMPATFTTILAEHIQKLAGCPAAEAVDGEPLVGGKIYIAPGNYHMTVATAEGRNVVRLDQNPPENFCRPAVDPMLRSLAQVFGRNVLAVILTGMGHDGLKGSEAVVGAGGVVIAQDAATSVVWGMPGAVATAGLCSAVLPIGEIGTYMLKLAVRKAA